MLTPPSNPSLPGILELHINSSSVRTAIPPTISDSNPRLPRANCPSSPSICLLRGMLEDFLRFSRQERSKWLIDLAHDICDPADMRGSLLVWQEPLQQWLPVLSTDPLSASIYCYDLPDGLTVGLSRFSWDRGSSGTSANGDETAMADRVHVKMRDGICWVSSACDPVVNTHILPERIGDHAARVIFNTFTFSIAPPTLSVYDEIFGLTFFRGLHTFFDTYRLGFRFVSQNNYECHFFGNALSNTHYTIGGAYLTAGVAPDLHGAPARPPHPERDNLPPAGLFRWHYLQCVIKRFGHDDFKTLQNINHHELPLRMREDSDDQGTDADEDWQSKALDLERLTEKNPGGREERSRAVEAWFSTMV